MDYSKALSFIFEDKEWAKKIAIGGFLSLFNVIFCFFIVGYYMGVLRNVQRQAETALPDWAEMGTIIVDGIIGSIIIFIYTIVIGGLCALAIVAFATNDALHTAEMVVGIVLVSIITLIALTLFCNLALLSFAISNNFPDAFNVRQIQRMLRHKWGDLVSVTIFSLILNSLMLVIGLGVLSSFTSFWGLMVQGHLFAQCAEQRPPVTAQ